MTDLQETNKITIWISLHNLGHTMAQPAAHNLNFQIRYLKRLPVECYKMKIIHFSLGMIRILLARHSKTWNESRPFSNLFSHPPSTCVVCFMISLCSLLFFCCYCSLFIFNSSFQHHWIFELTMQWCGRRAVKMGRKYLDMKITKTRENEIISILNYCIIRKIVLVSERK